MPKELALQIVLLLSIPYLLLSGKYDFLRVSFKFNAIDSALFLFFSVIILNYKSYLHISGTDLSVWTNIYCCFFYFLLKYYHRQNEESRWKPVNVIAFAFTFVCLFESAIIFYQFAQAQYQNHDLQSVKHAIAGTVGNPNSAACLIAITLPYVFHLFLSYNNPVIKAIILSILLICITALVLTFSRGAWLSVVIGVVITSVAFLKNRKIFFPKKIIYSCLVVFLIIGLFGLIKMNEGSAFGRVFIWKVTKEMILDNWMTGVGFGNFKLNYLNYQSIFLHHAENSRYIFNAGDLKQSHNQYLYIFAENGIIGISFFLLLVVLIIYHSIKMNREVVKKNIFISPVFVSSSILLVHLFFDCLLNLLPILIIFITNISLISFYSEPTIYCPQMLRKLFTPFQSSKHFLDSKLFRYSFTSFITVITGMLLINSGNRAYAYMQMEEGTKYMSLSDMNRAIGCFSEAMMYLPENGDLQFYLGSIYLNTAQQNTAIKYLTKSLDYRLDKNTYIMLGIAYQELKDYKKSENVFKELEDKFPNLLIPKLLLGQLYCETGDKGKAKDKLTEVTTMIPKVNNRYAFDIKTEAQKLQLKL